MRLGLHIRSGAINAKRTEKRDTMLDHKFIRLMQDRIAELAVGASAVRNQGAPEITRNARQTLKRLRLQSFGIKTEREFKARLNRATRKILDQLPEGAQNWGTARKIINLFLRDVVYNRYLCKYFKLEQIQGWLEVPLDSFTAKGIRRNAARKDVPKWISIKGLNQTDSNLYQGAARDIARRKRTSRVHLDLWYWRNV